MRISNVLLRPIVTEKTMALEPSLMYVFEVNMKASKGLISQELKRIYGVDTVAMSTMIMPGKKRRILGTRRFGKTKKWKKAVVKLKDGQKIELIGK